MKILFILLIVSCFIACTDCPKCPPCNPVILTDTIYVIMPPLRDTVKVFDTYRVDSFFQVKKTEFEKLVNESYKEVTDFRKAAIYQVDTMRANFLKLKRTKIYNNMLIKGDTLHKSTVTFGKDSIPKIIFE